MKILLALLVTLTMSTLAFAVGGTPHYTSPLPTVDVVDETGVDCLVGGSRGYLCWHDFSDAGPAQTTSKLGQMAIANDEASHGGEVVYVLDSSGNLHKRDLDSGTWVSTSFTNQPADLRYIVMAYDTHNLYAIAGNNAVVYSFDGSSNWTSLNAEGGSICAGADGSLFLNSSGTLKQYNGSSWSTISTPSGHTLSYVACGNAQNLWLIMTDGTLWGNVNASDFTWTQLSMPTGKTLELFYAWGARNGVLLTTESGGNNTYLLNSAGTGWTHIGGQSDNIVAGNEYPILYQNTNNTYYHFFPLKIEISNSISGYYDCTGFPDNLCPNGSSHSGKIDIVWTSGGNEGLFQSAGVPPANNLNPTSATGWTEDCDPFTDPGSTTCEGSTTSEAICAVMGIVFTGWSGNAGTIFQVNTWVKLSGPPQKNGDFYSYVNLDGCSTVSDPPLCPNANGQSLWGNGQTTSLYKLPLAAGEYARYTYNYYKTYGVCGAHPVVNAPYPLSANGKCDKSIPTGSLLKERTQYNATNFHIKANQGGVRIALDAPVGQPAHDMSNMK